MSGEYTYKELEAYARLVEEAVKDAFQVVERAKDRLACIKVLEFAKRPFNPVLSAYCDSFEINEETVRAVLTRKAEEALGYR